MPELRLEDHSEEVQEILGRIPKWVIRWGITVLFSLIAIVFIGSYFIPYPETISVPIKITTLNSPAPIVSNQGKSRIAKWQAEDKEHLKKGEIVAIWETDDNYQHINELESFIALKQAVPSRVDIPSFSAEIRNYNQTLAQLLVIKESKKHEQQIDQLKIKIKQEKAYLQLLKQQQKIKETEFTLLERQFKQDSIYYHDGGYGITKRDYEGEHLRFLNEKSSFIQYKASLIELDNSLIDLKNQLQQVKDERIELLTSTTSKYDESLFVLKERIKQWKLENIITAPIDGILDRTQFWSENQIIPNGEMIATITPTNPIEVICIAYIDSQNIAKIQREQKVLIKLAGFNQQEFGAIEGRIESVSSIPYQDSYQVKILLPKKLKTTENVEIPLIQELTGLGEVIISRERLFNRLVSLNK